MKSLQLSGTAKEIGRQHGRFGKDEIMHSLATYEKLFHGYQKIRWKEVRERALLHLKAIERYDPALIEEIQGIAEGAGVDFEDILALNARSEIALTQSGTKRFTDGCTSIGVASPVSVDTIIGQNWDWKGEQSKSLLLLEISCESKPRIKMVTEGGIIGKIGFNSAGIGVCLNALLTDKKSEEVPIHLGLRSVLNAFSLHEAISKINEGQMASAANFLIGCDDGAGNGMVMNVEVSPFGIDILDGAGEKAVHSNHLCSPVISRHIQDLNNFKHTDSMIRKMRAEQLLNQSIQRGGSIDEETFKEWLSDRFNAPNSINHLKNERAPEHRQIETVFSVIMNLSKKEMWLCDGKPFEKPYDNHRLDERVSLSCTSTENSETHRPEKRSK
ncbi:isopenicillin-N N-acyltransferase-like protein [Melghirimyces profundicolus]|uniref:Isopenicillin-N N-acyltransferase-like protein n=1 Tax=Melghirimyces profundicolus TaxID=1242148 RepID=A0A2T6BCE4_9BACL|nr:C45 family peptidase [Melghirimyces profundicolus]PTX53704.1 isopenicillin-N N-acyltransferase-like protein [Melghirimyces profundicolus]